MLGRAIGAATIGLGLVAACGDDEPAVIEGLEIIEVTAQQHVTGPVDYPQTPPVGGNHSAALQTCGAYDRPVPNELAVHAMEHGAVWITHLPDLPAAQVATLRSLASKSHVLVSPYPGLPSPVVASAWGRQVRLPSADDKRLKRFVSAFRQGPQAPERGAGCRGAGQPLP